MNKILNNLRKFGKYLIFPLIPFAIISCEKYDEYIPAGNNAALVLSTKDTDLQLNQKSALRTNAIVFNWTTGNNHGTGASVSYELQIDQKGNNFASPWKFDMGKSNYSKNILVSTLNDSLLKRWSAIPGTAVELESRIVATISSNPATTDISNIISIKVVPYKPVTSELYIVGDATPGGWDITNASTLLRNEKEEGIFEYAGALKVGKFKLPVNRNADWGQDMYMRDPNSTDSTKMYLHKGGESDDIQWEIKTAGMYKITVNLYDLIINIEPTKGPAIGELFMVGDATSIGWDIGNALKMVKDPNNPAVFKFDGMLKPGDFKFPLNRNTDWGQDMLMRDETDSAKVYLHKGGNSDDNKWKITKEGWYSIRLNVEDMTISIKLLDKLYIVGSSTPIGWSIDQAIELETGSSGYEFIYNGPLTEGEFKFPVDRSTSWGQDMFMKDSADPTSVYHHVGGDPDDSKWTLTAAEAGNYKITLNLKTMKIDIVKQ